MRKEMPAMHIALSGIEFHVHVVCCICMIFMIDANGYRYVCLRDMIVLYVGCENPLFYSLCILYYDISVLTPLLSCVSMYNDVSGSRYRTWIRSHGAGTTILDLEGVFGMKV